jgi:hypothetical protein
MITPVGLVWRVFGIIAIDDHPTRFSNFMSSSSEKPGYAGAIACFASANSYL